MARPKIELDRELIKKLAFIQCTIKEIALICGVSEDTLQRRKWFSTLYKKTAEDGRSSLRRLQWKVANGDYLAKRVTRTNKAGDDITEETFASPNPTMLIWLGKQYLGQADKTEIEAKIGDKDNVREYTNEELRSIIDKGKGRNGNGRGHGIIIATERQN